MTTKQVGGDFRLPSHVVPKRYELTLRPNLEDNSFSGCETIEIEVSEATSSIKLNAVDLELKNARVTSADGTVLAGTVTVDEKTQLATITFDGILGEGDWQLHIDFSGVLNDQLKGFYRSTWTDSEGVKHRLASTHFEPTHARRAFPCFDEPAMKATFQINLEIDERLEAVSNGSVKNIQRIDTGAKKTGRKPASDETPKAGKKRIEFAETIPMSTYLIAFVVGDLVPSETVTVNGTDIRIWSVPGKEHLTDFALKAAVFAVDFFEEYFEIPYPGEKIDHIAIPDFPIGAMENLGCITFRETALLVDEKAATYASLARVAEVVMHELAHMWFGDLVTMSWWNGLWLKESFATFMANVCLDDWRPEWNTWDDFAESRAAAAETDALASTHAIENPVNHPDEATEMFDIISYQKGCSVLYQLHEYLGAETFRAGCVRYLAKHAYGNTETHDLWDALEEACNESGVAVPVRQIMDAWVFGLGHPVIELTEGDADGLISVSQKRFSLLSPEGDGTLLPVPLQLRIAKEGEATVKKILLTERESLVYVGEDYELIVANCGGSGFYRVLYSDALEQRLRANLQSGLSAVERFNLVNDSWSMVRAGLKPATSHLALVSLFAEERDINVWHAIIDSLHRLHELVVEERRPGFAEQVRQIASPALEELGWQPEKDESVHLRKLRSALVSTLGTIGASQDVRAKTADCLRAWRKNSTAIDTELVPAVITVSAYTGKKAFWEEMLKRAKQAVNPHDAVRYLFSLARFRDTKLLSRTIQLCLSEDVRTQDAPNLLAALVRNPAAANQAWQFIKDNFDEMQSRFPDIAFAKMCGALSALDTESQAAEVREFFSDRKVPAGETAVRQMLERLEINVRMRQSHSKKLSQCFPCTAD